MRGRWFVDLCCHWSSAERMESRSSIFLRQSVSLMGSFALIIRITTVGQDEKRDISFSLKISVRPSRVSRIEQRTAANLVCLCVNRYRHSRASHTRSKTFLCSAIRTIIRHFEQETMSGVKRTRTDDVPTSSQPATTAATTTTTTTTIISPKVETTVTHLGSVEEDYSCPICFELINEAYVSRCGHSFWSVISFSFVRSSLSVVFAVVNVFNALLNLIIDVPNVN